MRRAMNKSHHLELFTTVISAFVSSNRTTLFPLRMRPYSLVGSKTRTHGKEYTGEQFGASAAFVLAVAAAIANPVFGLLEAGGLVLAHGLAVAEIANAIGECAQPL